MYKGAYMYGLCLKFTRNLKNSIAPFIPHAKVKSLAPTLLLIILLSSQIQAANGLMAHYYNKTNSDVTTYPISGTSDMNQTDSTINFSWPNSPISGINADYFQVRWTGYIYIPQSTTWTFYTQSDDGVKLTVNNQLVVNNWTDHGSTENSGDLVLTEGYYPIAFEFYEKGVSAVAKLSWSHSGLTKQIVPNSNLFTDYPGATVSIADASLVEGNTDYTNMDFTITLSQSANASINYATSDITATVGEDYNATSGTLTFTAGGATSKTVSVPIKGDTDFENNETFSLALSTPVNLVLGTTYSAIGTIINDDTSTKPTIQFQQSIYQTSENTSLPFESSSTMLMSVILSEAIDDNVTVQFTTQDGTAIGTTNGGKDYISQTGTITILAGETNATLPMYIIHDQAIELTETFTVRLTTPTPSTRVQLGQTNIATIQILEQTDAPLCYSDNFESALDAKWRTLYSKGSFTPQINAGHLKLTPGKKDIATAVTKDYEFPSKENLLIIEFRHYAYGGCFEESTPIAGLGAYGADGIVAVLYDSAIGPTPTPGAYGGSMGYAQGHDQNGFQGGWLGLGLDEYGNFANPNEGRVGGPGFHTNAAVIRGDGSGMTGYEFLAEAYPVTPTIAPAVDITNPDKLPADKFRMTVDARSSAHLYIKLERDVNNGVGYQTIINNFDAKLPTYNQSSTPDYVRFALTSGTGGGCNAHEIDDLVVRGNCSAYVPSLSGSFRVVEDTSAASWSSKWINTNLTTKVVPLNKRYCVLAGTSANNSASPLTSSVYVDVNLTDGIGFNQQIENNLSIPAASSTTCFDVNTTQAARTMWFIVTNTNDSTMQSTSDPFSIRPYRFSIDVNNSNPDNLIAGRSYKLDVNATSTLSDANVSGYSNTNTSYQKIEVPSMITCPTVTWPLDYRSFTNGRDSLDPFIHHDVMDINMTILDENWTSVDQSNGGCITGSDDAFSNPVGCLIKGSKPLKFVPHHFKITGALRAFDNNFTYVSNDLNMSALLDLNITAETEQNSTTPRYNSLCYAKSTDYNVSYTTTITTNALNRILFESNTSNTTHSMLLGNDFNISNISNSIFGTDDNGTGKLSLKINFDRNESLVVNPFSLTTSDVNVKDIDTVQGNKTLNQTTRFYYGRAHAPDYRFANNDGNATIYYEVYAKDLNQTQRQSFGINGNQGIDSIDWYQNTLHSSLSGAVSPTTSSTIVLGTPAQSSITLLPVSHAAPYVGKIEYHPTNSPSWLLYYPKYFMVEFYKTSTWAGSGSVSDTNTTAGQHSHSLGSTPAPTKSNKRLNW